MMDGSGGMFWGMGTMGLLWILFLMLVVLAIASLGRVMRRNHGTRVRVIVRGIAIAFFAAGLPFVLAPLLFAGATGPESGLQPVVPSFRTAMMHGRGSGAMMGRGMSGSMQRHMYYMRNGVPAAYRGKSNPLAADAEVIRAGAKLFGDNCASCHGSRGFGDGEAGRDLRPRPANLAGLISMPMMTDSYLLWAVLDGGERFESAMPAFKETLSENDVWKIVTALRAGMPLRE